MNRVWRKGTNGTVIEPKVLLSGLLPQKTNPQSSVLTGTAMAEASSSNRTVMILVPTIGLAVILYYSGLLGDINYYVEELMYIIGDVIPRYIAHLLGL